MKSFFLALVGVAVAGLLVSRAGQAQTCNLGTTAFFDESSRCVGAGRVPGCETARIYRLKPWRYGTKQYLFTSTWSSLNLHDISSPTGTPTAQFILPPNQPWGEPPPLSDWDELQYDAAVADGYDYGIAMFQHFGWVSFKIENPDAPTGLTLKKAVRFVSPDTGSRPKFARLFRGEDAQWYAVGSYLDGSSSAVSIVAMGADASNPQLVKSFTSTQVAYGDALDSAQIAGQWWLFVKRSSGITGLAIFDVSSAAGASEVAFIAGQASDFYVDQDSARLYVLTATSPRTIKVVDIANPSAPVIRSTITLLVGTYTRVAGDGKVVVAAKGRPGIDTNPTMQAFSVVNPTVPVEIAAGELNLSYHDDELLGQMAVIPASNGDSRIFRAAYSMGTVTAISSACFTYPTAVLSVTAGGQTLTTTGSVLLNEAALVSAAGTAGYPAAYVFARRFPDLSIEHTGEQSSPTWTTDFASTIVGDFYFGVAARYGFAAPDDASCADALFAGLDLGGNGFYDACKTVGPITAGHVVPEFQVEQPEGTVVASPSQPGVVQIVSPVTLRFTGRLADTHAPYFIWDIPGATPESCDYAPAPYTGSTCTIPANTLTAQPAAQPWNLSVRPCEGMQAGTDCGASAPAIPAPTVSVQPVQPEWAFSVSPGTVNIGDEVTITVTQLFPAYGFAAFSFDAGGSTCGGTSPLLPCGFFGSCVPGTSITFRYASGGSVRTVTGTGTLTAGGQIGASTAPSVTVLGVGSCPDETLSVAKTGTGTGTVTSDPGGIVCGVTCSAQFPYSSAVMLSATPAPGSSFTAWDGDCLGASPVCQVTMDAARNVVAVFELVPKGVDTPGIYRSSDRQWYLKNANAPGAADLEFPYGDPSDQAVKGDWDGDGDDTVGIYRDGTFFLRNSNSAGPGEIVFMFGAAGDVAIAGDWDGDGIDTVGVYRPATAGWLLRNSNSAGAPDLSFTYGLIDETPVVGDWDGNGTDTVGIFRAPDRQWYLRNANSGGSAELVFPYGDPAQDVPVVGDWDGDGDDTVGIYRTALGEWFLKNTNEAGFADLNFAYGLVNEKPLAGDWDGS